LQGVIALLKAERRKAITLPGDLCMKQFMYSLQQMMEVLQQETFMVKVVVKASLKAFIMIAR